MTQVHFYYHFSIRLHIYCNLTNILHLFLTFYQISIHQYNNRHLPTKIHHDLLSYCFTIILYNDHHQPNNMIPYHFLYYHAIDLHNDRHLIILKDLILQYSLNSILLHRDLHFFEKICRNFIKLIKI